MPWIESHQDLRTNPKAKRLARILEIPLAQAIGHLHMLWWWALDHAEDGDVSRFDSFDIADAAGWDGDEKAFLDALINCGPSDKHGFIEPSMKLHDWGEFTLGIRASRESAMLGNHKRWHEKRGISDPNCPHCESPPNRPRVPPESPPIDSIAPESPPISPPNRPRSEISIAPDSSRARAHVESTNLPTNQPTKGPRARNQTEPDNPQTTPKQNSRWDQAWKRINTYVRRYGTLDPDKPPLDLNPQEHAALKAIGGLTAVRNGTANRFDYRDAFNQEANR